MSDAPRHLEAFLRELGFEGDPEMGSTPDRVAGFLQAYVPEGPLPDVGLCSAAGAGGPVVVRQIPFYSLCAHHLLPFFGHATVAYVPAERLAGLGGIPRVIAHLARRPQLQERLCEQIASALDEQLQPLGLVVRMTARHMCVEMRGAAVPAEVEVTASRGQVDDRLWKQAGGR